MPGMTIAGAVDVLARDAPWACATCGNGVEASCPVLTPGCDIGAELVTGRLEEAGMTLFATRASSPGPTRYRCALPDALADVVLAYGYSDAETRLPLPDARAITRMDAVWRWLGLIPQHRYVIRRIVAARALTHPTTGRALIHWRALGKMLHCSHEACRVWHGQGIDLIVNELRNGR